MTPYRFFKPMDEYKKELLGKECKKELLGKECLGKFSSRLWMNKLHGLV